MGNPSPEMLEYLEKTGELYDQLDKLLNVERNLKICDNLSQIEDTEAVIMHIYDWAYSKDRSQFWLTSVQVKNLLYGCHGWIAQESSLKHLPWWASALNKLSLEPDSTFRYYAVDASENVLERTGPLSDGDSRDAHDLAVKVLIRLTKDPVPTIAEMAVTALDDNWPIWREGT